MKKKVLFEWQTKSTNPGHYFLRLQLETGPPFKAVIRVKRRQDFSAGGGWRVVGDGWRVTGGG